MNKDDDQLDGMEQQDPAEDPNQEDLTAAGGEEQSHSSYQVPKDKKLQLSGMYENWFLDYASYVILERAVPHIEDGFKPVQRRIMHAMKEADDGHFNKVANIVGLTMQYHPHGMPQSTAHWYSWDRRNCSSTPRVTGVTSSPATGRQPAVTSRPA